MPYMAGTTVADVAGIVQTGTSGSYLYYVASSAGNDPVTQVSWFDAARFCNWLQNGQPTNLGEVEGSTETGAYTLDGDTTSGYETKNAGATWWIPSLDEWYKAAYYDQTLNSGSGGYWLYATRSNNPPGNVVGGGTNEANYCGVIVGGYDVYSVTQGAVPSTYSTSQDYMTAVGSFVNSASYYGTYDQCGDVEQWNDYDPGGSNRGTSSGYWGTTGLTPLSSAGSSNTVAATNEFYARGFRVAGISDESSGTVPSVLSESATNVKSGSALLTGTLNPNGVDASVYFLYGTSTNYGGQTTSVELGNGTTPLNVTASLSDLRPGTLYHFQMVVTNTDGVTVEEEPDQTFSTLALSLTATLDALKGDPADGVHGTSFASFGPPIVNSQGYTAFAAVLQSGTTKVTAANNSGIWADDTNDVRQLIARTGVLLLAFLAQCSQS